MKHGIFSVYDQKAAAYLPPFVMPAQGMAIRVFSDCVADPEHQFGRHPEDYTLFKLGVFDDENASMEMESPPLNVAAGHILMGQMEAAGTAPLNTLSQLVNGGQNEEDYVEFEPGD